MKNSENTKNTNIRVDEKSQTEEAYTVPKFEKLQKLTDVTGVPNMTGNWQAS